MKRNKDIDKLIQKIGSSGSNTKTGYKTQGTGSNNVSTRNAKTGGSNNVIGYTAERTWDNFKDVFKNLYKNSQINAGAGYGEDALSEIEKLKQSKAGQGWNKAGIEQLERVFKPSIEKTKEEKRKKGIENIITTQKEQDRIDQEIEEKYSGLSDEQKKTANIIAGVGSVAPSLALQFIPGVGTAASSALMFGSTSGDAIGRALLEGKTDREAQTYGYLQGAKEAGIEALSGGIAGTASKSGLMKGVSSALNKNISNKAARAILSRGVSATGEGLEEVASTLTDPIIRKIAFKDEEMANVDPKDVIDSFVAGAGTSLIIGGGQDVINAVRNKRAVNNISDKTSLSKEEVRSTIDNLSEAEPYQIAKQIKKQGEGETVTTPKQGNNLLMKAIYGEDMPQQKIKGLPDLETQIQENRANIENQKPIKIRGERFKMGTGTLKADVEQLFREHGNMAHNDVLGDVALNTKGIKDSIGHGMSKGKAALYEAVPELINNGKIVEYVENHKGRRYNSVVLEAPVTITRGDAKGNYIAEVIVHRAVGDKKQRYYLHDVSIKRKRLDLGKANPTMGAVGNNHGAMSNEQFDQSSIDYNMPQEGKYVNRNPKQYSSMEQMQQAFFGKPVEQNTNTDYTNNTDTNGGSADAGIQSENGRGILSGTGGLVQPRGNGRESGSGENPFGTAGPVRTSNDEPRLEQDRGGSVRLHSWGVTPRVNTDTAIRESLAQKGKAVYDMRNTDDGVSFFNAITQAKKENPYGAYVTAYNANDYTGFRTMLDDTGKAGIAVKPDGDIISVFNNPTSGRKKAVSTLLINALDAGGTKLDNFDGTLSEKYEQHGFVPVARVAFDREYAPDGWNYERDGTPDVIFWVHNGDTPEQVAQKIGTYEHYDTSRLPLFGDYDSAQAYRDSLLERQRQDNRTGPQGESRTARRFVNGETTLNIPEGMQSALNEVVESQNTYRKTSIQGARDLADKTIKERGIDGAYTEFLRNLNAKKAKKAENHVLGARLVEAYANLGDMERAADVLKAMRDTSTESAQLLALNKVLYEQGGTGMLMQIQRDLDAINKEYGTDIKIKDDLMQKLNAAEGKEQIESVAEEIYNDVAPQVPVKKGEKLDAWRRLAMLANPKTQVRNLLGNAGVKGMRDISGVMDGILQTVFIRDPSKRTNSFLVSHKPGFKEAKNWATDYFAQNESVISDGTRYEGPKNKILENRQIFKSRPMRAAEKGTNWAMGKGDTIFLRNRFARSVAEEAATRGVTVADLEGNAKLRNEIVSRAIKEAQEQTFHDSSALATSINKTVRKLEKSDNPLDKALSVSIKGFMPFTKTPVNIAKRAVDYSPLGFVKTIYNGLHDASPMRAANTINSLSKNLTGSALAGLGYVMAESGMLRVGEDDKQEYTDSDQGRQRYSLEIGGTSISLDWLAPTSIPLFFGATLSQVGDANSVKDVESLAQTFFGPMLDMSMMSSVDDAVTEIRKADTNISGVVSALLYTPFESYALQYLPTMGSQLNQTIDPTRRTTQTMSDGLLGKVEKTGRKALNKLPGANRLLEALGMDNAANQPYVDMWGNKQTNTRGTFNDNVGWRALQAFVMPSYINQVKDDPVYDEMKRLYNAGENGSEQMLPSNFGDEVKNGGTTYPVRGTDSTNYKTQKGQTQYNLLRGLMNTDAYRSASDAERIKMVQDAYKYAEYKADKQYLNNKGKDYTYSTSESTGRISDWQYKVECLEQSGISPETYFGAHRSYKNAEGEHYVDKWGETKTTSGTKRIAQVEALKGHGMTAAQKLLFMYMEQPSARFNAKYVGISNDQARRVVFNYVNDLNLSREEKEKILKRAGYYITDRGITWK